MRGECKFRLSGQVGFFKDNPVGPGKPYASITVGLKIPTVMIAGKTFKEGMIFLNLGYNDKALKFRHFNRLLEELPAKPNVIISGDLKPKLARGDYPAGLNFDGKWEEVGIGYSGQPMNDIYFFGETVSVENNANIVTKFSYRNPSDNTWKDREYTFNVSPNKNITHRSRDQVIVFGKVVPTDASGNKLVWLYGEHIL